MTPRSVLLIEDMTSLQVLYRTVLMREGYDVYVAGTAAEGEQLFTCKAPDIVLLDLLLPDRDGLELLAALDAGERACRIIVITAHGSIRRAVSAMRAGAFDFLVKPFDDKKLLAAVGNARSDLRASAAETRATTANELGIEGLVGQSPQMLEVFDRIARVAPSTAAVFVTGDTGTGKAMCARAIHALSNRRDGPCLTIHCTASESGSLVHDIFGSPDRPGALSKANGGTLVLSEIGAMPMEAQTRLLHFLQGSDQADTDVRLICLSSVAPARLLDGGQFREDLFFRLNVLPLHLPPLRARGDDVLAIARDVLNRKAERAGQPNRMELSPEVKRLFTRHPWPGNVRQLLNLLESVALTSDSAVLEASMLPTEHMAEALDASPSERHVQTYAINGADHSATGDTDSPTVSQATVALAQTGASLAEIERQVIEAVITLRGGSVPSAARHLGVSPSTLYRKLEAWKRA